MTTPLPQSTTLLLTGSTGLVGRRVQQKARERGLRVVTLRHRSGPSTSLPSYCFTTPPTPELREALNGATACIHLAGEPIMGYWTSAKKQAIVQSRTEGTRQLCELLASLSYPPKQLVSASAIGWYGHRGPEYLSERSTAGRGFLASTCQQWEEATQLAQAAGIATAHARIGVVLSPEGGALKAMLPAFKLGVAGPLGDGLQGMSWIHIDDLAEALLWLALHPEGHTHQGAFNLVAPTPVSNAEFTKTLASQLKRPAFLPAPALALRLILGDLADVVLHSQYVHPERLQESGFQFHYPHLHEALANLL